MNRFLTAVLNPPFFVYLLLILAFPRWAWPAVPTPIPTSVLPVDFPTWCAWKREGRFEHLISTKDGVYVVCQHGTWLFKNLMTPAVRVTLAPGIPQ